MEVMCYLETRASLTTLNRLIHTIGDNSPIHAFRDVRICNVPVHFKVYG